MYSFYFRPRWPSAFARISLPLLAALLLAAPLANAKQSAVSARDYGVLPKVSEMSIAPSGDLIAYRMTESDRDLVMVYNLEKGEHVASLNIGSSGMQMRNLYFATEDELILQASKVRRVFGYRGELELSTAYAYNIRSKDIRQLLTPGDVIYKGQEGLGRIAGLSGDNDYVYMPAYVPDSPTDQAPRMSLVRVDLDSPRRPRVHFKGTDDSLDFFLDENGEVLVHEIFDNRKDLHKLLVRDGDDWKEIFREETEIPSINVVGMTPGRDSLVIVATRADTGRSEYYTLSIESGEFTNMGFGRDDADIEQTFNGLDRVVWGVRYSGFNPSYRFFDEQIDQRVQKIVGMFPDQSVWLSDWSEDWNDLIVYVEGSNYSGNYYKFSADEPPTMLASTRPEISAENIHPIGKMSFKARDGLIIPNLLTIPKDRVSSLKNLPTVIMPHGGPASYDRIGFDWMAQALANRGYLVVQPQFRGSTGFGLDHERAGRGEWGGKMQDDLSDAVATLVRKGVSDPDRICIVGASYGGYAALAGGAFTPELYRCVVAINGVADLPDMMREEERNFGDDHWVVAYWKSNIGDDGDSRKKLDAVSPAQHAENFRAPVLLIHGEDDQSVPFSQSKNMYKKLKRAKKSVELIELEDETHNLMQSETRLEAVEAMVAFVDKHLQM